MTAQPLRKIEGDRPGQTIARLETQLAEEKRKVSRLRERLVLARAAQRQADRNAVQWHALLLQEKIRHLPQDASHPNG